MRADLSEISQSDIINKVLGRGPKFILDSEADPSGLWNRKCYALRDINKDVLTEIQKISNKILELTLWKKDEDTSSAKIHNLQDELNKNLEEFDKLNLVGQPSCDDVKVKVVDGVTSVTSKCSGINCSISGGTSRKKCRGKKSRCKKSRGKKSSNVYIVVGD
jgi:hypothetical protein